ncbi:MAG: hypothetical protein J6W74_01180 [Bacteroidales bacterium]|nr:hypothetical protein [Bacteroidales bacterium]
MKKVLSLILAAAMAVMLVSCGGSSNVGKEAEAYMKDIKKAVEKDNSKKAEKAVKELEEWFDDLSKKDKRAAEKAINAFLEDNEDEDWVEALSEMGIKFDFLDSEDDDDDDDDEEDDSSSKKKSSKSADEDDDDYDEDNGKPLIDSLRIDSGRIDIETIATNYMDELYRNLKAGNNDKIVELVMEIEEWTEQLSDEDNERLEALGEKYLESHPDLEELLDKWSEEYMFDDF